MIGSALVHIIGKRVNVNIYPREDKAVVRQLCARCCVGKWEVNILRNVSTIQLYQEPGLDSPVRHWQGDKERLRQLRH